MVKLVLVESPSKCNQIEKYLGEEYKVLATYGHFRELTSLKNIVISKDKSNITINFTLDSKKEKNMALLQKHIEMSDEVILATDDDREGESIAWHICDYFKLPIDTTKRIIFHEITKPALQDAVANPTIINMNIVQAQFTRQILDLMIGFKISPLLWRYIATNEKNSLSAGRCQTPALKLIYDNHIKIQDGVGNSTIIYKIVGHFTRLSLPFKLNKTFDTEDEVTQFLKDNITHSHIYSIKNIKTKNNNPPIPLNTSRLQQMASNELNLSPKDTMRICQTLYEKGLITYMRTENTKYSSHFVNMVKHYLSRNGDDALLNTTDSGRFIEKNSKAHEAIRPTNINIDEISDKFDNKIRKMYKLIWENSIVSCLEPSTVSVLTACISAPNNYEFIHESELIIKPGWTKYKNFKGTNSTVNAYNYLKTLTPNTVLQYSKISSIFDINNNNNNNITSGLHYTESRLIKLLEEEGIGRPSTFAMLVDKIQTKDYVNKENIDGTQYTQNEHELSNSVITHKTNTKTFGVEKNKLIIKTLGMVVLQFIYKHFEPIFNYEYTRNTELILDQISNGTENWITTCVSNKMFIDNLIKSMKINGVEKFSIPIDGNHTYMMAKYGPVVKHTLDGVTTFLPVRKDIELSKIQNGEYVLMDILIDKKEQQEKSNGFLFGILENKEIFIKTGRYGRYATWGEVNKSLKRLGNRDIKNITMDEMTKVLQSKKTYNKKK
jgi:DNA topoisomerase-1